MCGGLAKQHVTEYVIQNSKWLVPLHYPVKDQPDRDVRVLWGVTLLSDTVKEERSTI